MRKGTKKLAGLAILMSLTIAITACSSSSTSESSKKQKKKNKSETVYFSRTDKKKETTATIKNNLCSLAGISYSVPVTLIEYIHEENQLAYQTIDGTCFLIVESKYGDADEAKRATRSDYEMYASYFTEKMSYGGNVIDTGLKETEDFWIWHESSDVATGNHPGLYLTWSMYDRSDGMIYDFLMIIQSKDDSVRKGFSELWDIVTESVVKNPS